jgi:hypothetical protein
MSIADVLIGIPLIPLLPVMATWWLPWGAWSSKIPKSILGPYLLYACLAAWHFAMPWWFILVVALWGVILTGIAITQGFENKKE